jgi:hypothetical protein
VRRKIDTALVATVWDLWRGGVKLTGCCQGGCFTTNGPSLATIEFVSDHIVTMRDTFPNGEFDTIGRISVVRFPAPERCPMWDVEAELGEAANTRPYSI